MSRQIILDAARDAFVKLNPAVQLRNPVMTVVAVGALLTTALLIRDLLHGITAGGGFALQVSLWLWFTVLFANFAEALAEGRGKAQAKALRGTRSEVKAKKVTAAGNGTELVDASLLRMGDIFLAEAGDVIAGDGEIIEGIASVDESAITGESAPVIREAGGDRSSVIGGTRVLSDWIKVRVSTNPGETFLDRMIALVEGAKRQKTPNEIALTILLISLTMVFLVACATLEPMGSTRKHPCRSPSLWPSWSA
jgi:K+-transporting ATPase ATPase B chain